MVLLVVGSVTYETLTSPVAYFKYQYQLTGGGEGGKGNLEQDMFCFPVLSCLSEQIKCNIIYAY